MTSATKTLSDKTVDHLQDLIRINIDSSNGFAKAAEEIRNAEVAQLFLRLGNERRTQADRLRQLVHMTDEEAEDAGSIRAKMHRWWIDVVGSVKDGDEYAILAEAERGEDAIKHTYEDAVRDIHEPQARDVVQAQYTEVKQGHDLIRDMRDARKDD